jgi:predicted oxidoreductase
MERFAREAGREMIREGDAWSFVDGVRKYKPVMVAGGWKVVWWEPEAKE